MDEQLPGLLIFSMTITLLVAVARRRRSGYSTESGSAGACPSARALAAGLLIAAAAGGLPAFAEDADKRLKAGPTGSETVDHDQQLARQVLAQLAQRENVVLVGPDVSVDGGIVTLHGTVATSAEKHLASRYVQDIRGVSGVVNAIIVDPLIAGAGSQR